MYPEIGSKRNLGASGSGSGTRTGSGSGSGTGSGSRTGSGLTFGAGAGVFSSTGGVLASTSTSTSSVTGSGSFSSSCFFLLLFSPEFLPFLLSYSSRSYFSLVGRRVLSFSLHRELLFVVQCALSVRNSLGLVILLLPEKLYMAKRTFCHFFDNTCFRTPYF